MEKNIYVCQGRWCHDLGSESVQERIAKQLPDANVQSCRCLGHCERAVTVKLDGDAYIHDVTPDTVFDKIKNTSEHRFYAPDNIDSIDDLFLDDIV